jgi:hypothetical protein
MEISVQLYLVCGKDEQQGKLFLEYSLGAYGVTNLKNLPIGQKPEI